MAAWFLVQNDSGTAQLTDGGGNPILDWDGFPVQANAYIPPAFFRDYHDSRGQTYVDPETGVPYVDAVLQIAIVKATDYLDARFNYIGWRRYSNQGTAWPRWDAVDINDRYLKGIPQGVQMATAEYAWRALSVAQLVADPTYDASGRNTKQTLKKVGTLELMKVFEGAFTMPKYPSADRKLYQWGLVLGGGKIVRA